MLKAQTLRILLQKQINQIQLHPKITSLLRQNNLLIQSTLAPKLPILLFLRTKTINQIHSCITSQIQILRNPRRLHILPTRRTFSHRNKTNPRNLLSNSNRNKCRSISTRKNLLILKNILNFLSRLKIRPIKNPSNLTHYILGHPTIK